MAICVPGDVDLSQVVDVMVEHNLYRILVTDNEGHIINLITQSTIIKLLSGVLDSSVLSKKTIQELNLGFKEVISINEKDIVLHGFKLIKEKVITFFLSF